MIPALVQWELTERCPYRCIHCYLLSESLPDRHQDLTDDDLFRIAELIVQHKIFYVTFTGGEPLTRRELVVELARYLSDHNVILSLNTCLAPMTDAILAALRVEHFLISCPSSTPALYASLTGGGKYDRFESQLRQVIGTGVNHTVNMVVSQRNRDNVRSTAERMAELGVRRFAAMPVSLNARSPRYDLPLSIAETRQVLTDLIWAYETFGLDVDVMEALAQRVIPQRAFDLRLPFVFRACQAGKRNGTIGTNGDVRPCGHNPNVYGNVLRDDLGDIWERMQGWRAVIGNEHRSCLACDLASSGGCPIDAAVREAGALQEIMASSSPVLAPVSELELTDTMVIRPSRRYLERPEGDGWLVTSGRSRDILHVNEQLRDFLVSVRTLGPTTLDGLAHRFGTTTADQDFRRIVAILIGKHFFLVVPNDDNAPRSSAGNNDCGDCGD